MGCKFSFKRIFLVASLSLAGLFGISSILINKQVKENPVVEKASADASPDDSSHQYNNNLPESFQEKIGNNWYRVVYIHIHSSLGNNKRFANGGNSNVDWHYEYKNTGYNPSTYMHFKMGYPTKDTSGGVLRSSSEIIGDYAAKLYLPTDSTYMRLHSNTDTSNPMWKEYGVQANRSVDISLSSSDALTKNAYWLSEDNYDDGEESGGYWLTENDYFARFYTTYFTITSSWNDGNSSLSTSEKNYVRVHYSSGTKVVEDVTWGYFDGTGLFSSDPERGTPICSNMIETLSDGTEVAKFLVPRDADGIFMAKAYNTQKGDNNNQGTYYSTLYDNFMYCVTADSGSPASASYGRAVFENGYYLYGSFNSWSSNNMVKLTLSGGDYVVTGFSVDANTEIKVTYVENYIHDPAHDYGFGWGYSPFPLLYPIDNGIGDVDHSHFYIRTADTYDIKIWSLSGTSGNYYCGMSIEPPLTVQYSINNGEKQTMIRTGGGFFEDYQVIYSSSSAILPNKDDTIQFYVNGDSITTTYAESSATNSLSGSSGNIYVNTELLSAQTLIFETTVTGYLAYMGGHRNIRISSHEGIISGTDFYVRDWSEQENSQNIWSMSSSITWIRFYDPIGYYDDTNQEAWMNFGSTTGGAAVKSPVKVPQYNGKDVAWSKIALYRCASGSSQPDPDDVSTYWNASSNVIQLNNTNLNGVTIHSTNYDSRWSFNDCYLYEETDSTSGLAAGDSLYIKDAGGWLTESTPLYCYFFNPVGTTGTDTSAAATLIPYSESKKHDKYYELTIPGAAGVKWRAVILLTSTDGTFEHKTHQSSDILVTSESKAKCQYLETGQNSLRYIFTDEDRSDCFVAHFLDVVNYGICKNYDGYSSNLEALQAVWVSDLKADFDKMDSRASTYFENADASPVGTDLEKAASTYDFVVKKYNKSNLVDFASRDGVSTSFSSYPFSINYILGNNDSSNMNIILIIIASSISILSITALSVLLVKKRKSQ